MVEIVLWMVLGFGWLVLGFIAAAERRQHAGGSPGGAHKVMAPGGEALVEQKAEALADAPPWVQPEAEPVAGLA